MIGHANLAAVEPAGGVTGWATDLMERLGAPGAGLAIALENLFPPLPSEVILPLAGFTASRGDPEVVRQLLARTTHADPPGRLTPRERDVLGHMAEGHTNASIAALLHVSQSAVEKHVAAIFDKLGLSAAVGYSRRVLAVLRYLDS